MTVEPPRAATLLRSVRVRIIGVFLLLLVVTGLLAGAVVRGMLQARLAERIDADLAQESDELQRLAADGIDPRDGQPFGTRVQRLLEVFLARNVPDRDEAFLAYVAGSGTFLESVGEPRVRVYADPAFRDLVARTTAPARGRLTVSGEDVEYVALPLESGGEVRGVFTVVTFLAPLEAEIADVTRILAAVGLGALLLAGTVLRAVAGRLVEPVRDLEATARAISSSDLGRRIEVRGRDEVSQLARTFNAMLDRLEEAFESQRDFVNDAGHELRTPITVMRGHLDLLDAGLADRAESVPIIRDELARMTRFVDDLLVLAKARRPDFLALETVDVAALSDELVTKARSLADRDWRSDAAGRGRIVADRQRLTQAVMQLAQNATQHTARGDEIALGSAVERGEARFWVRDTGAGVPEREQERIFQRFARGSADGRRSEGAGLGLAIVRAIAEAHHGRVEVRSREGAGATFTLVLPVDPPSGDGREQAA